MQLRPYQEENIEAIRGAIGRGVRRILYQLMTGGGKTVMMARMADGAQSKQKRAIFCVHRQELLTQASLTFERMGIKHGRIAPGFSQTADLVQVASVQTLVRRMDTMPAPDLLIFDEAHHCPSSSWRKIAEHWPRALVIGVTATPVRTDGQGLRDLFDVLIQGPSATELMEQGYLCGYRVYAPPSGIVLDAVQTRMGDFARSELEKAVDKPTITGDAVAHYRRICPGKRAIAFCVSVAHSEHVAASFRAAGVNAVHIDGSEHPHKRAQIMRDFGEGRITVLCNCDLISEGFDVPAVEAVILLRPTQSLSLYLQQVGRALRPHPGKEHAIILDHASNALRHGLPDDAREWTLEGKKRKRGGGKYDEKPINTRQCPKCFIVNRPVPACIGCGHVFEVKAREVAQTEGSLVEVDPATLRLQRQKELKSARSYEELVRLGHARGYKNPEYWAKKLMVERQQWRNKKQWQRPEPPMEAYA